MHVAWLVFGRGEGAWLLWGGAAGLLLAVMVGSRCLVRLGRPAPALHALLHWLPIVAMALVAALLGSPKLAVAVVFGTSVAALSTVIGFVTMTEPMHDLPPRAQRIWMFLPVPALLVFLLGFGGNLGLFEAAALAIQGALAGLMWITPVSQDDVPAAQLAGSPAAPGPGLMAFLEVPLALCLAAVSGWAATRGADLAYAGDLPHSPATIGATLLSVALVMPMVSSGTPLAMRGQAWAAITAQAGLVLLNLCLLLPAVILVSMGRQWLAIRGTTQPATFEPVIYSRIAWRIDAVVLLILCLLFVPVAGGRLKFDRTLAGWLIGGYAIYMLTVIALGRWGG